MSIKSWVIDLSNWTFQDAQSFLQWAGDRQGVADRVQKVVKQWPYESDPTDQSSYYEKGADGWSRETTEYYAAVRKIKRAIERRWKNGDAIIELDPLEKD